MHGLTLITTVAAGFGLALVLGFIAVRLGLPALIGYLLAGVLIGPATPGYVADVEIAGQLAYAREAWGARLAVPIPRVEVVQP